MNKTAFKLFLGLMALNIYALAAMQTSLELRTAAFFHSSSMFRHIYGKASGCCEAEGALRIYDCMETWLNFDWFAKDGKTIAHRDPTRVNIANLSLGVKYRYSLAKNVTVYLGIGPSIGTIWIHNHGSHDKKVSKVVTGGVIKSGIYYYFNYRAFVDFFVDYLYQPTHFEKLVDIGGLRTGVGVGMRY